MDNIVTLGFLILLQLVLGFDNLLYITLESQRAPKEHQKRVRRDGIMIAVGLRIMLLFAIMKLIDAVQEPFFTLNLGEIAHGEFNLHAIIVLVGGVFILQTAVKEIWHMMSIHEHAEAHGKRETLSAKKVITLIVTMNVIFSVDSILSAMALTHVMWVMATAIIIGGAVMIYAADFVSEFLQKNRMYEVLGLFILLIVGIMLLTEGGHLAHLELFGNHIVAMSKTTFYFVVTVLILTDVVQSRYKKKILLENEAMAKAAKASGAMASVEVNTRRSRPAEGS